MQKSILAIGAIILLSTTATMAQQREVLRECAQDIKASCGDVPPGGIRSCLNSHLADLTRPCQVVLLGAAALARECRTDVQTLCGNVEPGAGRIEACLQTRIAELSPSCIGVVGRTVGSGQ
jgi:hypothetical protein